MFHVEQPQFVDVLIECSSTFSIVLNRQQISQLTEYHHELLRWNKKVNLTAIRAEKEIVVKHFVDSLACTKALTLHNRASLLDVGSGAGFPGLPLKVLHPQLSLTLLEPNEKKTSFLRHIIGTLDLKNVTVVSKTLRDFARTATNHGRFSYVITRALAATQILPFSASLLEQQGRVILCRTKPFELDPGCYGLKVSCEIEYDLPYDFGHRVLTVLEPAAVSLRSDVPRGTPLC